MIIDADVHITPVKGGGNIQAEELIRRMDYAGVDKALTWLQPAYFPDVDAGNALVYEAAQNYPDRILGFGWVDPHFGVQAAKEQIKRCVEVYGFYGLKLNGAQNRFYIDSESMALPLIEEIAKTGKILAFHIGTDAFEATHPYRLAKIARRFPETRILAVHMGGVAFHDLSDAAIEAAQECPNITLIGSGVRAVNVLKAIKTLGAERVCFGSDTPFAMMHVELVMYEALLKDEVTDTERSLILGGNIARLFNIEG
ncbi:MAG: amidohydrolase family protein [Anaerolineales bacterium]|nr:amidohydrolase family protein [Anaerolineales bacterium]